MSMETLEEKLEGVKVSYSEFVESLLADAKLYGIAEKLERFIDENPGVDSGDVLEYEMKLIGLI